MTVLERIVSSSPRLAPRTKTRYLAAARDWMTFAGADPWRWTPDAAQVYYARLLARIKPQSANTTMHALRYMSRRLAELNHGPDFAKHVELAPPTAIDVKDQRALTAAEADRLLRACGDGAAPIDLRDYAMIYLGLRTGMRRFSMAGIHFEDFGVDRRTDTRYVEIAIKGRRRHRVPLAPATVAAMQPWLTWLRAHGVTSGPLFRSLAKQRVAATKESYVSAQALSGDGLYKALMARAKLAGIADVFHPHTFRHTMVSWCQRAGLSNAQIAAITGHLPGSRVLDSTYTDAFTVGTVASDTVDRIIREGR